MEQAKIKDVLIKKIRTELLESGYSLSSWARANGYLDHEVKYCVYRYANKQQCPQSPRIYAILKDILRDTGVNLMENVAQNN